ncbi:MAG: ATP-binding protein [Treponema sp.]|nr:ATP-binding protein [Treponema sp.]
MSIRIKVFLIILVIVLAITASSVVISISSAQNHILKTLETDMEMMVELSNEYIVNEIVKLENDASAIAQVLRMAQPNELMQVLMDHIFIYPDFMSISVINSIGMIEASFPYAAPVSLIRDSDGGFTELARRAFGGEKVISTTYPSSSGMIFYVFVPMEDFRKIVVLTVNSSFFNERVKRYSILKTGFITMLDRSGKIIADVNSQWVEDQVNFMELAQDDSRYEDIAKAVARMQKGARESGRYTMPHSDSSEMSDYIVAYMPITPSADGWILAVFAPIRESTFYEIRYLLIISGLVFFGLGMVAAALASGVIAKPFEVAKALAKAKTTFLANLSHDMRTPLNMVIGLSDLSLTKKGLPEDVVYNLEKIYGTGINLLGVVNDLLDISNMDSGKFGIMPGEYDVPALIHDTINSNIIHIGSKPISFKIVPDDKLPARLVGDGLRLRQVFNNLLHNAFIDTTEGTVEWKIATEKQGDSIWLVSSVSDTGPGIKAEDLDKIFLDYSNQDTSKMRSLKGAGLSLALTKRMTDLLGGTISVESTVGKGTTFTVRIPQKQVNDDVISAQTTEELKKYAYVEQRRRDNAEMERKQLAGKRVLIVDDGAVNLEVAQRMIEPYGIAVDCVSSGQLAVELVRKAQPIYDAIFMTRMMPGMDGREIVYSIRNEIGGEYSKTVPIIALTTNTVTGNTDIFLKWGFQDVLSKPLDIHRLDKVIRRWIAKEA